MEYATALTEKLASRYAVAVPCFSEVYACLRYIREIV